MRIFLLPLTTRQALVHCQRIGTKASANRTLADRITRKAADTWAKWEAADSGWQKKLVTYGNRGLQRIPYQEWGLKSFPPSNATTEAEELTEQKKFDVVYPGNIMDKDDVPKVLRRLAKERKTLHFNRFIGSMIGMPFTAPFMLIPVIPNVPFFYLVYRCWSHWRALKGSDHLDFILDNRLFRLTSSPEIEAIYEDHVSDSRDVFTFVTASEVEQGEAPPERPLLSAGVHASVAKNLQVSELSGEVERAVWQVNQAMKKEQQQKEGMKESVVKTDQADTEGDKAEKKGP